MVLIIIFYFGLVELHATHLIFLKMMMMMQNVALFPVPYFLTTNSGSQKRLSDRIAPGTYVQIRKEHAHPHATNMQRKADGFRVIL